MDSIRYGLIGAGMMGQEHIRNINLLPNTRITAVADPNEPMRSMSVALAGDQATGFADFQQLLAADLCDAYVIAAPNDLHAMIMTEVMKTDKPILCEKPITTTVVDCNALLHQSRDRKAPVWVAMEYRYMPPVQRLMALLDEGRAGPPRMMSIREHRFPFLPKVDDWNRFSARTGGTLVEKCCHFWDLMRLVLQSDPVRVFASGAIDVNHVAERYDGRQPDILDNAYVVVDFANGARAMLDLCMFAEGSYWQEVISVTGDRARIDALIPGPARFSIDGEERNAEVVVADRKDKKEVREIVPVDETILQAGDHHGSTFFQHQRFADLVRNGSGEPEVSLEDGYWSVLVGTAAEQSARRGEAVVLTALKR